MDDWKLLPRPERVTELYFTNYRQLRSSAAIGAPQTVAFTVRNSEHQATTYQYALTATSEDDLMEHSLGGGKFTLAHDHSLVVSKRVVLPPADERLNIKVSLRYKGLNAGDNAPKFQKQSIHYWTTAPHVPGTDEKRGDGV